ncbi:hypothetical protein ACOSQ3_005126 [Xanthoceras sorbifolium]
MVEKEEHQSETHNLSDMGTLNLNANSISENIGCLSNGGPPDLSVVGYRKVDDSGDGVEKILNRGISCDLSLESVGGNESKKSDLTQGEGSSLSGDLSSIEQGAKIEELVEVSSPKQRKWKRLARGQLGTRGSESKAEAGGKRVLNLEEV